MPALSGVLVADTKGNKEPAARFVPDTDAVGDTDGVPDDDLVLEGVTDGVGVCDGVDVRLLVGLTTPSGVDALVKPLPAGKLHALGDAAGSPHAPAKTPTAMADGGLPPF